MMRYLLDTYGCTMNLGEALALSTRLKRAGHERVRSLPEADTVVLVTCTVIERTERRMWRLIRRYRGMGKHVVLGGCLAEVVRDHLEDIQGVTILPPREYPHVGEVFPGGGGSERGPEMLNGITYIVPIAQGCLGRCTYCITRLVRGRLRSMPPETILDGAAQAVRAGAREIYLSAQDAAVYGRDMGTDLVDLVGALVRIPGEFRVRIGMMNPGSASGIWQRLLDVYARSKVYRFLHLPVQSGSERILARMGRDHDLPAYLNMVREFRRRYDEPDSLLSTDIIVGFPGESEKDMCSSMELIRESAPDIVNVTRFSSRPGTPASRYPDRPSGAEVKARSRALTRLRFEVSARRNARLVGRVMDVLVTGCGRHGWRCRSDSYRPVVVPGDGLAPGERVRVRITGSGRTHLVGMPVR